MWVSVGGLVKVPVLSLEEVGTYFHVDLYENELRVFFIVMVSFIKLPYLE